MGLSLPLQAACLEKVAVGDPGYQVIEQCGKPERRERYESSRTQPIEVLRGSTTLSEHPLAPKVREKWYYDTTLDETTVITIDDGGVLSKERMVRDQNFVPKLD